MALVDCPSPSFKEHSIPRSYLEDPIVAIPRSSPKLEVSLAGLRKRVLTPRLLEKIRGTGGVRLEISDALCPGLVLRVTEHGVKSFSVIYRVPGEGGLSPSGRLLGGKQHRITLGRWPIVDLTSAREKAREIRIAASAGRDPRIERRNLVANLVNNNFAAVCERYIDRQAKTSMQNWKNVKSLLDRLVIPEWGNLPIVEITRTHAHALLDKIAETNGPKRASAVRKDVGRVFAWAVDREIVTANPFLRMDRPNDEKYQPRERFLSDAELCLVWKAADKMGYPIGTCVQLLILTGLRRDNVASSQRTWIDKNERILVVPKKAFKSRRVHEVPLSNFAWDIIAAIPEIEECHWLFPAARGKGHIDGWSTARMQINEAVTILNNGISLPSWTIHDLRHTVKTGLSKLGIASDIKDRVLGHAKSGMDAVYDHHDYREEKREALDLWAEHIQRILN